MLSKPSLSSVLLQHHISHPASTTIKYIIRLHIISRVSRSGASHFYNSSTSKNIIPLSWPGRSLVVK